jgi:predicted outer membrane repeat protein
VPGAVFIVNTTLDLQDANPGDGICDDGTGKCALRAAIMEANALPGADEVVLPNPGWYRLTIAGSNEDACLTGDLDITDPLTITGLGPDQTVVDASLLSSDRVFHVRSSAMVTGLTIRGGTVYSLSGGGIAVTGSLEVIDCVIENNSAPRGGGIGFFEGGDHSFSATRCVFRNNTAVADHGGGIGKYLPMPPTYGVTSHVTLTDCAITGNIAADSAGGAWADFLTLVRCDVSDNVAIAGSGGGLSGRITMEDSLIQDNVAGGSGGGVSGFGFFTRCVFSQNYAGGNGGGTSGIHGDFTHCEFSQNQAGADGGGVYLNLTAFPGGFTGCGFSQNNAGGDGGGAYIGESNTTWSATECLFSDNTATLNGGGIRALSKGALHGCTLSGNESGQDGGGASLTSSSSWAFDLWSLTISGNRAAHHGGGIYLSQATPVYSLWYATVTANTADADGDGAGEGGGIFSATAGTQVKGSIIAHNFVGTSGLGTADCAPLTSPASYWFDYSVVGVATGCLNAVGYCPPSQDNCFGTSAAPVDPLLEPLGEYGGLTPTHALRHGSPAIDRVIPCALTDQRGLPRQFDGDGDGIPVCDSGATEFIDCNTNAQDDGVDIAHALSDDCNDNLTPDECDIAQAASFDCQPDGVPDECQLADDDCNATGVPDECEAISPGDFNGDGIIDPADLANFTDVLSGPNDPPYIDPECWYAALIAFDLDQDLDIDLYDFAILQALIGP